MTDNSVPNLGAESNSVTVYAFDRALLMAQGIKTKGQGKEQEFQVDSVSAGTRPTTVRVGVYPQLAPANKTILKIVLEGWAIYTAPGSELSVLEPYESEMKLTLPGQPHEWDTATSVANLRDVLYTTFSMWYGSVSGGTIATDVLTNLLRMLPKL